MSKFGAIVATLAVGTLALAFTPATRGALAQEADGDAAQGEGTATRDEGVRVYLDCPGRICDHDFLRSEIRYVDYVRDRYDAQVHVLVTSQSTGGGGRVYTLDFIGREAFEGKTDTLRYDSPEGATQDDRRRGIAHVLKLGLIRYAAHSPLAGAIRVAFDASDDGGTGATPAVPSSPDDDPWNQWVFGVGLGGSVNGGSAERSAHVDASLSADRTTPEWRISLDANAGYDEQRYELTDDVIESIERTYRVSGFAVRSVAPHLSLGMQASIRRTPAYFNRERDVRIAPAVEYSVFPYEEANRRQFVVAYSAGTSNVRYYEETIFFKTRETLYNHRLRVSYGARQPWGSAGMRLIGSQYLDLPERYRVELGGNLNLRLTRGLSLNLWGSVSRIDDQLYIPRGEATPEEVLLRRRQLQTDYSYRTNIGFRYNFGSIYNNVVNQRFDHW